MKPAAITSMLLLLMGATANAQLTLLPQVGLERSNTSLSYNNLAYFSPLDAQNNFKASLRLDYRFKKGHGPYAAIGTTPAAVAVSFTDPAAVMNGLHAAAGSLQWRIEGGYQYSSKPIFFKKSNAAKTSKTTIQKTGVKKSCGSRTYSSCTSKSKSAYTKKNNSLNMRLQPSAGLAYKPGVEPNLASNGAAYQYRAGNWNTAVVAGLGLEFGKGTERLFTLSSFYTKGLGNLGTQTLTTAKEGKSTVTQFSSKASSWGLTLGVPISLIKKKAPAMVKPVEQPKQTQPYRNKCGSYRYSSIRHI